MSMRIRLTQQTSVSHNNRTALATRGFTLIEMLVTIAILGILAAIVIPSYYAQVRKGGRSDAIAALNRIAQDLERCRSDNLAYNHANCTDYTGGVQSERGLYTIAAQDINRAADQNAQDFTLRADPVDNTMQAGDTNCTVFLLDHTGLRRAFDTDDGSGNNTTTECWR